MNSKEYNPNIPQEPQKQDGDIIDTKFVEDIPLLTNNIGVEKAKNAENEYKQTENKELSDDKRLKENNKSNGLPTWEDITTAIMGETSVTKNTEGTISNPPIESTEKILDINAENLQNKLDELEAEVKREKGAFDYTKFDSIEEELEKINEENDKKEKVEARFNEIKALCWLYYSGDVPMNIEELRTWLLLLISEENKKIGEEIVNAYETINKLKKELEEHGGDDFGNKKFVFLRNQKVQYEDGSDIGNSICDFIDKESEELKEQAKKIVEKAIDKHINSFEFPLIYVRLEYFQKLKIAEGSEQFIESLKKKIESAIEKQSAEIISAVKPTGSPELTGSPEEEIKILKRFLSSNFKTFQDKYDENVIKVALKKAEDSLKSLREKLQSFLEKEIETLDGEWQAGSLSGLSYLNIINRRHNHFVSIKEKSAYELFDCQRIKLNKRQEDKTKIKKEVVESLDDSLSHNNFEEARKIIEKLNKKYNVNKNDEIEWGIVLYFKNKFDELNQKIEEKKNDNDKDSLTELTKTKKDLQESFKGFCFEEVKNRGCIKTINPFIQNNSQDEIKEIVEITREVTNSLRFMDPEEVKKRFGNELEAMIDIDKLKNAKKNGPLSEDDKEELKKKIQQVKSMMGILGLEFSGLAGDSKIENMFNSAEEWAKIEEYNKRQPQKGEKSKLREGWEFLADNYGGLVKGGAAFKIAGAGMAMAGGPVGWAGVGGTFLGAGALMVGWRHMEESLKEKGIKRGINKINLDTNDENTRDRLKYYMACLISMEQADKLNPLKSKVEREEKKIISEYMKISDDSKADKYLSNIGVKENDKKTGFVRKIFSEPFFKKNAKEKEAAIGMAALRNAKFITEAKATRFFYKMVEENPELRKKFEKKGILAKTGKEMAAIGKDYLKELAGFAAFEFIPFFKATAVFDMGKKGADLSDTLFANRNFYEKNKKRRTAIKISFGIANAAIAAVLFAPGKAEGAGKSAREGFAQKWNITSIVEAAETGTSKKIEGNWLTKIEESGGVLGGWIKDIKKDINILGSFAKGAKDGVVGSFEGDLNKVERGEGDIKKGFKKIVTNFKERHGIKKSDEAVSREFEEAIGEAQKKYQLSTEEMQKLRKAIELNSDNASGISRQDMESALVREQRTSQLEISKDLVQKVKINTIEQEYFDLFNNYQKGGLGAERLLKNKIDVDGNPDNLTNEDLFHFAKNKETIIKEIEGEIKRAKDTIAKKGVIDSNKFTSAERDKGAMELLRKKIYELDGDASTLSISDIKNYEGATRNKLIKEVKAEIAEKITMPKPVKEPAPVTPTTPTTPSAEPLDTKTTKTSPSPVPTEPSPSIPKVKTFSAKSGDGIWDIAEKVGKEVGIESSITKGMSPKEKAQAIFKRDAIKDEIVNQMRNVLKNPELIKEGQEIPVDMNKVKDGLIKKNILRKVDDLTNEQIKNIINYKAKTKVIKPDTLKGENNKFRVELNMKRHLTEAMEEAPVAVKELLKNREFIFDKDKGWSIKGNDNYGVVVIKNGKPIINPELIKSIEKQIELKKIKTTQQQEKNAGQKKFNNAITNERNLNKSVDDFVGRLRLKKPNEYTLKTMKNGNKVVNIDDYELELLPKGTLKKVKHDDLEWDANIKEPAKGKGLNTIYTDILSEKIKLKKTDAGVAPRELFNHIQDEHITQSKRKMGNIIGKDNLHLLDNPQNVKIIEALDFSVSKQPKNIIDFLSLCNKYDDIKMEGFNIIKRTTLAKAFIEPNNRQNGINLAKEWFGINIDPRNSKFHFSIKGKKITLNNVPLFKNSAEQIIFDEQGIRSGRGLFGWWNKAWTSAEQFKQNLIKLDQMEKRDEINYQNL